VAVAMTSSLEIKLNQFNAAIKKVGDLKPNEVREIYYYDTFNFT
jgi:hypothetical protein